MNKSPVLIDADELLALLGQPGLAVIDASWYLPAQSRNAVGEFEAAHVPGAVFFDQDAVVDPVSPLPHTLPSPGLFADALGRLGVSSDDRIVVYDGLGLFSAPRVWWMLRVFGAKDVRVLNGGMPAWKTAGHPTESGMAIPEPKRFAVRFDEAAVVDFAAMRRHVEAGDAIVADARSADRFSGSAPEPRPGVRSGHMPGAHSLPFTLLAENGRLKEPQELRSVFAAAGVDPEGEVITTCGSGITAAVINLALVSLGNERSMLYDGSWTEWGSASDTPVVTSAASATSLR